MKKRTNNEIQYALEQLSIIDEHKAAIIRVVLLNRMSQSDVFRAFMQEISDNERNEDDYYLALDAAKYLSCDLDVESLIDGAPPYIPKNIDKKIVIEEGTLKELLRRVGDLENEVKKFNKFITRKTVVNPHIENKEELINKNDAAKLIGCPVDVMTRWTIKGIIPAYRISNKYYYKKSELNKSQAVINYKRGE